MYVTRNARYPKCSPLHAVTSINLKALFSQIQPVLIVTSKGQRYYQKSRIYEYLPIPAVAEGLLAGSCDTSLGMMSGNSLRPRSKSIVLKMLGMKGDGQEQYVLLRSHIIHELVSPRFSYDPNEQGTQYDFALKSGLFKLTG